MDAHRFDALTRALSTTSRRGLLGLLLTLPGLGGLLAFVTPDETEARGRRKRRKKRHKHGKGNGRHRNGKRKDRCKRKSRAKICAGKCGIVKNRKTCKKNVDCGACGEAQLCEAGICQPCDVCAEGCRYTSIQQAIDLANDGDVIRICAGIYQEGPTIAKPLTLLGAGDGEDGTVLDGEEQHSVMTVRADAQGEVRLEGLRLTGGGNTGLGGGLYNVGGQVRLTNCTVTENTAASFTTGFGGGIFNGGGEMTLIGCTVSDNTALYDGYGGGILNEDNGTLSLTASTVTRNEAGDRGGGIYNNSGTVILEGDSSVCENTAPRDPNCVGFVDPACTETCPA